MRVTLLGCGSSAGVPEVGCLCRVCQSPDPKNTRSRVSVHIENDWIDLLVDSSPDLRQQALRYGIKKIDAVLYTHAHADHTGGLDDLRAFNKLSGKPLPIYANEATMHSLSQRFPYAFLSKPELWYRPCVTPNIIEDAPIVHFNAEGAGVTAFGQVHGKINTFGYRIGNIAYSTDCNQLPESAFDALSGVEVWIVDCLRYTESYTHSNLKRTLEWIERVKPGMAILTHMAHDFDYNVLSSELPTGVVPGYDGMVIRL